MAHFLITGSSRGLGLKIVEQLALHHETTVSTIFATARSPTPAAALEAIIAASQGRVQYVQLDVTDPNSIATAAETITHHLGPNDGLDTLINCAGVQIKERSKTSDMKVDDLEFTFSLNVTSVHRVTSAFLPLLYRGNDRRIVNITSTLGSLGTSGRWANSLLPSYKISKAALNMLTVQYSLELESEGFTVFSISPGWLKTDLGGSNADLEPEVGAAAVVSAIVNSRKEKDNGVFRDIFVEGSATYTGENCPW